MAPQFNPSEFTASTAKPLPVILLLDTSDSMNLVVNPSDVVRTGRTGYAEGQFVEYVTGGKSRIDVLNEAARRMLGTFAKEESQASEFLVSVVTFGGSATLNQAPTRASDLEYNDLTASGGTPLGAAIDVAKTLIEDRVQTPSRAYRPLVVLVSDGEPNDSWEDKLEQFIQSGRSAKCDRMALGIGKEAISGRGRPALDHFIAGTEHQVFEAKDAGDIHNFFKFVTMSVVTRGLSQNPNLVPPDTTLQPPAHATTKLEAESAATAQVAPATTEEDDEDSYW